MTAKKSASNLPPYSNCLVLIAQDGQRRRRKVNVRIPQRVYRQIKVAQLALKRLPMCSSTTLVSERDDLLAPKTGRHKAPTWAHRIYVYSTYIEMSYRDKGQGDEKVYTESILISDLDTHFVSWASF